MNRSIGARDGAGGRAGYTGRTLVLLADGAGKDGHDELHKRAGIRVSSHAGLRAKDAGAPESADGNVCFDRLGVAVVESDPEQTARIAQAAADDASPILAAEPERIVRALAAGRARAAVPGLDATGLIPTQELLLPTPPENSNRALDPQLTRDFLRGYREAITHLEQLFFAGELPGDALDAELQALPAAVAAAATWGLTLTRVTASKYSGKGTRIAVLDTGLDLRHPDFVERGVISQSFVAGETAQDTLGHGTHCIGTAAGPLSPRSGPRYGVAHGAQIYAGKVLDSSGLGDDATILAGIEWALSAGVEIVSMSLGAEVSPGESFSQVFESAARRAANQGTLIIAAAGNESRRSEGAIAPVGHPANCPSIVAVGALDQRLRVADFSNGGLSAGGGEVNIAAPGVNILSAWPLPTGTHTISGTSMATPHVAGIAALFAEASGARGFALANAVLRAARRLTPGRDFGWGLVQSV